MSDLQSQLNLLNEYIKSLQKQTQSKSNEIKTLTDQNNQLIIENENLRIKSKTTVISNTSTVQKLEIQLKQIKTAYTLLLQNSSKSTQAIKLKQTITRLEQQKNMLFQYKQKLQKQIRQFGYHDIQTFFLKLTQYQNLIIQNQQKIKIYQTKIIDYQRKNTLLSNQINIKTSQIQRLNDKLKSNTNHNNNSATIIRNYQIQTFNYQKKITQITNQLIITKSQVQKFQQKINNAKQFQINNATQFQTQNQAVIRQHQNLRRQNQALKRQINSLKRQINNLEQRINTLSHHNSQITIFEGAINTLRTQKKQWESQRQDLIVRVTNLQTQIVEKSNVIGQLRLRQDYMEHQQRQSSQKDNQVHNLNNTIRIVHLQIQEQKKIISYRESTIRNLQAKISSFDYSKASQIANIQKIVQDKNNQINRLIESHNFKILNIQIQLQKYKQYSISNNQITSQASILKQQNNFLKKQAHNNNRLIQQLQRQKQNLKIRIIHLEQQIAKTRNIQNNLTLSRYQQIQTENTDGQLKNIVKQLRAQLQQVKKSNSLIHDQNHQMQKYLSDLAETQIQMNIPYFANDGSKIRYVSPHNMINYNNDVAISQLRMEYQADSFIRNNRSKHIHSPYFKSQVNIQKKRQYVVQRSVNSPPVRDMKSLNHNNNNKQKWENLQRKISALRVQNDQLKKTLLND